ncbi:MAG: hypothetical protein FJY26_05350 [Betaproteobacteria bacterium]|nr:hypothetical protein [Betaproteobacteria bacterium]
MRATLAVFFRSHTLLGLASTLVAALPTQAQTKTAGGHTGLATSSWARATAALAATADTLGSGWDQGHWRAAVSPYAPHLRYSPEHADVWAVALERQRNDRWMAGGSFFNNSFGQPSTYVYLGKRFPQLLGHSQLFGQFSGGLLYGYRGKYENKVPFNHNGFSPGALASIGWQFNRQASLTVHAVGDAAVMFQFAWDWR